MKLRRIEIGVIAVLIVCIIGYAAAGLAVSAIRVSNAERTLNSVVSHQNTLNSTFSDINTQLAALNGSTAFNPQEAIVLVDKSVSNSELATKTINGDQASLNDASSQLDAMRWLTFVGRNSLDREATRLDHARSALGAARTIAEDEAADGHFWHSLYAVLSDLTTLNTQSGGGDLTGAQTTLGTMKTDIAQALTLSSGPGLPSALRSLVTDMQSLVDDYGKQLAAKVAGDDASVTAYQANLDADLVKIAAYDFNQIGADINAFYQPLIDRYNREIGAATA